MSKIIIGIHGLGNKPPKKILKEWWKAAIKEGLNHIDKPHLFFRFDLVYWADLLHSRPENPRQIDEPYFPALKWDVKEPEENRRKIQKFIEKQLEKLLLNEDGTLNFSSITDKIIQHYFHDLDIYYSAKYLDNSDVLVRDAIRARLLQILKKHQGKDIMLIGHSMGTIIAYDVLKNHEKEIEIDTFVTIGSPLGLPIIRGKILEEHSGNAELTVPVNVTQQWYNFSDLEDKVAINFDLADDYNPSEKNVGIVDFEVNNNYEVNDEKNPHKSYGYLRTPELAEIIDTFLLKGKIPVLIWLTRNLNNLFFKKIKV